MLPGRRPSRLVSFLISLLVAVSGTHDHSRGPWRADGPDVIGHRVAAEADSARAQKQPRRYIEVSWSTHATIVWVDQPTSM